jgi:hypothetical protein
MHCCLTLHQQLLLPFASCLPQQVAVLPLVATVLHILQLILPSASASCCISFLSTPASCHVVSQQPATLQPPPSIASPANGWLLHLPPAPLFTTSFVFSPTVVYCVIINAANAMLPVVLWQLLKLGIACWNQPPSQEMMAYNQSFIVAWSRGPPFDLAMSNIRQIDGNI